MYINKVQCLLFYAYIFIDNHFLCWIIIFIFSCLLLEKAAYSNYLYVYFCPDFIQYIF